MRADALALLGFVRLWVDSFAEGADLLERAVSEAGDNLARRTPMLVNLAFALFSVGRMSEGARRAQDAVSDAERLGDGDLLSQALAIRELLRFMCGDGLDEAEPRPLLGTRGAPGGDAVGGARVHAAGSAAGLDRELDRAAEQMLSMRKHCVERGEEK